MGDSRRENARFSLKWGFCEGKTCDFHLHVGFLKRKLVFFCVNWEICEEKMRDFRLMGDLRKHMIFGLNGGFSKRKCLVFWCNGGFAKRKRVTFA